MPRKQRESFLNVRSYAWSLITYATEKEVNDFIFSHLDIIKYYAYIKHDFDLLQDGSPKEPHIHILLVCEYNIQLGALINKMRFNCNTFGEPLKDKKAGFEYLTHKHNIEKYQYNENDICTNNKDYFLSSEKKYKQNDNLKYMELINDLINGCTYRDLIIKYGRDFIIHYKQYQEMAYLVLNEKKVIIDNDNNIWSEKDGNITDL